MVPENIYTPPRREFHLGPLPPPPPSIFHICKKLMTTHPCGISTKQDKDPQTPLEKFIFHKKGYQSKERCHGLLSGLELERQLEHSKCNLNYKILLIPLTERDKVVSVS